MKGGDVEMGSNILVQVRQNVEMSRKVLALLESPTVQGRLKAKIVSRSSGSRSGRITRDLDD